MKLVRLEAALGSPAPAKTAMPPGASSVNISPKKVWKRFGVVTGRGSPAREDAYPSWMESADAPDGAGFYLSALKDYAVTGGPFQTLAAPEVLDVINRQAELMRLGDASVDEAVATIMDEAQSALDALEA